MFPILANIPVDAIQLFGFLGSAGAVLWIINQFKGAFGANPPLHKAYASKDDLTQVHGRIKREREETDKAVARLEAEQRLLRGKLDEDLEGLRDQIAQNNKDGEQRVTGLRTALDEQTKLIISVIRKEGQS